MRSVLCYGDSNTFGQKPGVEVARYAPTERWPGILRSELGREWLIHEEGLSGRTTVNDDPIEGTHKNGRTYLKPCLESHTPLDLIILMLGTNDLKVRFRKPASEVAMSIGCLIHDIKDITVDNEGRIPEIMIVSPPHILEDMKDWERIFAGAPEKSRQLALEFEIIADSLEVHFFDAATVITCDERDGFHFNKQAHHDLGIALAREVEAIGWVSDEA